MLPSQVGPSKEGQFLAFNQFMYAQAASAKDQGKKKKPAGGGKKPTPNKPSPRDEMPIPPVGGGKPSGV